MRSNCLRFPVLWNVGRARAAFLALFCYVHFHSESQSKQGYEKVHKIVDLLWTSETCECALRWGQDVHLGWFCSQCFAHPHQFLYLGLYSAVTLEGWCRQTALLVGREMSMQWAARCFPFQKTVNFPIFCVHSSIHGMWLRPSYLPG